MTTQTFSVTGMTCGHCEHAVASELKALDGVTDVSVDLVAGGPFLGDRHQLNPLIAGAAVAFSSVFVVSTSLRLRRFQAASTTATTASTHRSLTPRANVQKVTS